MKEIKLIGLILKHYRKENKYTREDIFRLSKGKEKELSLSTIRRIENHESTPNRRNIDAYAHVFNMHYCDNESLYNKLDSYLSSSLELIKNGAKINKLKKLFDEILKFNKANTQYIYLSEISNLMIMVLNIYLYNNYDFSLEKLNLFDSLLDYINDNNVKAIAYYYLYKTRASFKFGNTQENIDCTAKYIKVNFSEVFHFDRIDFLFKDSLLDFYNYNKKIYNEQSLIKNVNKVYFYSILSDLAFCELNLGNYGDAKNHLLQAINIEDANEYIPNNIYVDTMKRLGIINYCLKLYKDAFLNLLEARNKDKSLLALNYCLLFKSAEMIGKQDIILKIIDEDQDIKLVMAKNIFTYYRLKYNDGSLEKQEKYICTYLNKKDIYATLYFELFADELKKLVEQTKHYQLYYTYINQEQL